jgi:uncharacterized protein YecT (DUF1311 family)
MPHKHTSRVRGGRTLILACALLLAGPALATPYPNLVGGRKDPGPRAGWFQQCQQVRYQRPPADDMPRSQAGGRCDATALYYDTLAQESPSDSAWQAVRECAFRTSDSAVLMMLYANGYGVAPNLGVAMKFACSTESTAAEMKSRLAHLTQRGARTPFDLCDDVTAGARLATCAHVRERQGEKLRNGELATFVKRWSAREQLGFEMVRDAARHFAEHRRDYETDTGGPSRARLQADVAAAEYERFASDVEDFEKGKLPRYSEGEFAALERKMNDEYQRFMQGQPGPNSYLGTIRKAGVEKTQRAWLAYRDALELFGSIKYPGVPASGWRALLTARRLRQLNELDDALMGK